MVLGGRILLSDQELRILESLLGSKPAEKLGIKFESLYQIGAAFENGQVHPLTDRQAKSLKAAFDLTNYIANFEQESPSYKTSREIALALRSKFRFAGYGDVKLVLLDDNFDLITVEDVKTSYFINSSGQPESIINSIGKNEATILVTAHCNSGLVGSFNQSPPRIESEAVAKIASILKTHSARYYDHLIFAPGQRPRPMDTGFYYSFRENNIL